MVGWQEDLPVARDDKDERTPITDDQILVSRRAALRRLSGAAAALALGGVAAACKGAESGGSSPPSTELRRASFTQAGASGSDIDTTRTADDKGDLDAPRTADPKGTDADSTTFADPKDFDITTNFTDPIGQGRGGPGTTDTDPNVADFKDSDVSGSADSKLRDADTSRAADPKGDPDTNTVSDPVGSRN